VPPKLALLENSRSKPTMPSASAPKCRQVGCSCPNRIARAKKKTGFIDRLTTPATPDGTYTMPQ
jgi:hypothetical protein